MFPQDLQLLLNNNDWGGIENYIKMSKNKVTQNRLQNLLRRRKSTLPPFMTNEEKIKILREIEKRIDKANEEFAKNIGEIFHEFTEAMTAARQGEENKALEQAKKEKL